MNVAVSRWDCAMPWRVPEASLGVAGTDGVCHGTREANGGQDSGCRGVSIGRFLGAGTGGFCIFVVRAALPGLEGRGDIARLSLSISNETGFALRDVDTRMRLVMSVDQEGFPSLVMRDRGHNTNAFHPIKANR